MRRIYLYFYFNKINQTPLHTPATTIPVWYNFFKESFLFDFNYKTFYNSFINSFLLNGALRLNFRFLNKELLQSIDSVLVFSSARQLLNQPPITSLFFNTLQLLLIAVLGLLIL